MAFKTPIKVLHLVDKFPGPGQPKQDKYPLVLKAQKNYGLDVAMVAHSALPGNKSVDLVNLSCEEVELNKRVFLSKAHRRAINFLSLPFGSRFSRSLESILAPVAVFSGIALAKKYINVNGRPDLIHVWGERDWIAIRIAIELKKKKSIPIIWNVHHFGAFLESDPINNDDLKVKEFLDYVDCFSPVSEGLLAQWIDIYGDNIPEKRFVIPNPVDENRYRPVSINKKSKRSIKFFHISKLNQQKNIPLLLKSFSLVSKGDLDMKLYLAGNKQLKPNIIKLISDLEIEPQVEFMGVLDPPEVAEMMMISDIYIQSSDYETFCIPVAEALMAGTPVVSTNTAGPSELIKDFCGELSPVGDLNTFVSAIQNCIKKLPDYDCKKIQNYAINKFGTTAFSKKCDSMYRNLMNSKKQNMLKK